MVAAVFINFSYHVAIMMQFSYRHSDIGKNNCDRTILSEAEYLIEIQNKIVNFIVIYIILIKITIDKLK